MCVLYSSHLKKQRAYDEDADRGGGIVTERDNGTMVGTLVVAGTMDMGSGQGWAPTAVQ